MENTDELVDEIVNKIHMNKISTTEVADCLGKKGALPGICPITRGHFRTGRVRLVYAYNESNWELHEQLESVKPGEIVLVETHNCGERAAFGALVSKYLLLYRRVAGIVVNGYMRDAHILIKENYPIWCRGLTPIGCHNRKNEQPVPANVLQGWKEKYEGAIAICDDCGVVIIPPGMVSQTMLRKLDFIELQEDIWNYCVNTKKWSTYDTVCLKKYLQTDLLPPELKAPFEEFLKRVESE